MELYERIEVFLKKSFAAEFDLRVNHVASVPFQLRNKVNVRGCCINNVAFTLVELRDEKLLSKSSRGLLNKLVMENSDRPLIFISRSFNRDSLVTLRELNLGYIAPNLDIYIPYFFLMTSSPKLTSHEAEGPLKKFATLIVYAYLMGKVNRVFRSVDVIKSASRMSRSRALTELEQRGIVEVEKIGRENRVFFTKTRCELWKQRDKLLAPLSNSVERIPSEFVYPSFDYLVGGESLLTRFSLLSPPEIPCIAVFKYTPEYAFIKERMLENPDYKSMMNFYGPDLTDVYFYDKDLKELQDDNECLSPIILALTNIPLSDERVSLSLSQLTEKIGVGLVLLDEKDN
jgi:hypothetical protein